MKNTDIIKTHSIIGANIVGQLGLWEREQQIIRCHHERYDGAGYPDGLKGTDIPFLARILSVADVYDALASDRTYRSKMDPKPRFWKSSSAEKAVFLTRMSLIRFLTCTGQEKSTKPFKVRTA